MEGRSRHKSASDYIFLSTFSLPFAWPVVGPKRLLLKYLKHNAVDSKQAAKANYGWLDGSSERLKESEQRKRETLFGVKKLPTPPFLRTLCIRPVGR